MTTPDARELAIGLTLGLIDTSDAVVWADTWVMQLDDLPYWLIEISTSSKAPPHALLKLLPVEIDDLKVTDQEFIGAMAVRFVDQCETLDRILPLLYDRFCLCEWTEMTNIRQQIYLIDDEWDWDRSRAVQTANSFLMPYLTTGRSLLDRISRKHDSVISE